LYGGGEVNGLILAVPTRGTHCTGGWEDLSGSWDMMLS